MFLLKKQKIGLTVLIFNCVFLLIISILPIGKFLLYQLEKKYHNYTLMPKKVDGILILGGASNPYLSQEYERIILNNSSERLIEAIILIKKYKDAKIIFSGGLGDINYPNLDHAKVARDLFISMGVDVTKILFENKSRNTYENILFSKKVADIKDNEKWILITSAFHMNRAMLIAKKHKWKLKPYPVDFRLPKEFNFKLSFSLLSNIRTLNMSLREWVGLLAYYLMGRTSGIY